MGRRIEFNRRISNDRVQKIRKQKNKILIAVEGNNKTEKKYFNNFENIKRKYNITYARGNDTDPLKLVQMLIKEIKNLDLNEDDIAYCVFDTDTDINKNGIINDAIKLAKENNIKTITSNPCIELWFLLHFDYTTANMDSKNVIKRLKEYYPKYDKNINIYPYINSNVDKAIYRAKQLQKYQLNNGRKIGSVEANPNTEVYIIVEELIK